MQKHLSITLLLGFLATAAFSQDCTNPMLNRTDIQTRFGGSANILNTSRIAGNLSVCPFLSGQTVCVSDEGFASLQTFMDSFKKSFNERSQRADQQRFGGIGDAMKRTDMNDTKMKLMFSLGMLFNQTVLSMNASGAAQPFNFTAFYSMVQQMGLTSNKSSGSEQEHKMAGQPGNRGPRALQGSSSNQGRSNSGPRGSSNDSESSSNRTGQNGQQPNNTQGKNMPSGKPTNQTGSRNMTPPTNATRPNNTTAPTNMTRPRNTTTSNHTTPSTNSTTPTDSNSSNDSTTSTDATTTDTTSTDTTTSTNSSDDTFSLGNSQGGNLRRLPQERDQNSHSDNMRQNWNGLQKNLMEAKSKCAVSVMKHMYFASCMAASGNVSALNQSNSSSSAFKITPDACSGFKSKCMDYFTYSAAAESTRAMMANANSTFATELYQIVTSTNDTTTIYSQLNTLAATVLAEVNASGVNSSFNKPAGPLMCNTTNSNASDCDYICTKVLNSTGFDEDAFNNVSSANSTSTSRRHLDSSASVTIDPSGANPDAIIDDNDAAVVVSVSSDPDSSSATKVFTSITLVMTALLLSMTA